MSDRHRRSATAAIVLAGVGAALAAGCAYAVVARARSKKDPTQLGETVEELRARADRILAELSEGIDALVSRSRASEPHTVA